MDRERYERYAKYYTKEYLMGPNSFVLLDELLEKNAELYRGGRVLDLGCGQALTSVFLAKETKADPVFALDLWIRPTENDRRIREHGLDGRVIPVYGDALKLPFAEEYFDSIVSVDTYHYFGCADGVFAEKILPFVKPGGSVLIAVPGLKYEPEGELLSLLKEWNDGEEWTLFRTAEWWKRHLAKNAEERIDIRVSEGDCYEQAWNDWFKSGNDYGSRDREYLERGLWDLLNFVMIGIRKKA